MRIETMSTLEREGGNTKAPGSRVCIATRQDSRGDGWVVCLTDADGYADGPAADELARTANRTFREAYGAYEGLSADRRLAHALLNANEHLDIWWNDEPGKRHAVALAAVALNADGVDYIAVGDGSIAVFEAHEVAILRRATYDRTREQGPRAGLRGLALSPGCADRGRYPMPPNPKGTVVIGTDLLGCLDDDALQWTANMKLGPRELVRALVDAVADQTRNRRPGVHVTATADW